MLNCMCHRSHRPHNLCVSSVCLTPSCVSPLQSLFWCLICLSHCSSVCLQDRRECERMQSTYSNQNRTKSLIFDSQIGFCKGKIKSSHFLFHAKPTFCFNMTVKSAFKSHIHSILALFLVTTSS